ncbi:GNAT family N-acetyltransferase [Arthrobacter sp. JSM 101049]|uniref:GNAT family N-acetyltransferase n=1 Tax=Arthrobacter sp. JSM 101049 TaxID=929097 RepID=UPI003566A8A5
MSEPSDRAFGHAPTPVLRPWTLGDRDVAAVQRAFAWPGMAAQARNPIATAVGARSWLEPMVPASADAEPRCVAFAIDLDGVAVGHVMVSAIERVHLTGWVSYWVAPPARGRGLAGAATAALADHCFTVQGLFRLELGHRLNNPASGRVAAAAGFVREGTERQKLRYRDGDGCWERYDTALWARLATDPAPAVVPLWIAAK